MSADPQHDVTQRVARKIFEGQPLNTGERLWVLQQLSVDVVALAEEET